MEAPKRPLSRIVACGARPSDPCPWSWPAGPVRATPVEGGTRPSDPCVPSSLKSRVDANSGATTMATYSLVTPCSSMSPPLLPFPHCNVYLRSEHTCYIHVLSCLGLVTINIELCVPPVFVVIANIEFGGWRGSILLERIRSDAPTILRDRGRSAAPRFR